MTSQNLNPPKSAPSSDSSEWWSELEESLKQVPVDQLEVLADSMSLEQERIAAKEDIVGWAEEHFYIEETEEPIKLEPHQAAVLRYAFQRNEQGRYRWHTIIYSGPKKCGKTTIGGLVTRWAAETWGRYGEVLCVGNDAKQAQERAYQKLRVSCEMTPGYQKGRQVLPGRWKIQSKESQCLTSGTKVRAIATDYAGEAGANPILIVWTELWGFIHRDALRFWAEMAPSPTKPDSITWVETYAGYEGESELLWGLYESTVLEGRQLTAGELGAPGAFEEAPNADSLVPCYVNEATGMFAYWDDEEVARRMSWQKGEHGQAYYQSEAARQTPSQFTRLHLNKWVSAESEFVPMALWDRCKQVPWPLEEGERTPLIIGLDAAVTQDNFGLVVVSRDPDRPVDSLAVRMCYVWKPPPGGTIDFSLPEKAVREICENFNVVQIAYDPHQLHDMSSRLMKEGVGWFRSFGQVEERLTSDKLLLDLIVQKRLRHDGDLNLREHIANANAKKPINEDNRIRIVKKSESRKIDLAVALSMAGQECLRLNMI